MLKIKIVIGLISNMNLTRTLNDLLSLVLIRRNQISSQLTNKARLLSSNSALANFTLDSGTADFCRGHVARALLT